ncbi:MAG: Mov34/MPN/PAD-1 family protein [Gaiellaceae bacterium]
MARNRSLELPAAFWLARAGAAGTEVCGLVFERGHKVEFHRVENLGGFGEFWIDELELRRVERSIEQSGGRIVAFVHSHPHSSEPSSSDRALRARVPWPVFVVAPDDSLHEV